MRGGVDARGHSTTSSASVAAGKAFVRDLDMRFDVEFRLIPAVSATIPTNRISELVPLIRHNPRVDYIEPVQTGRRASQDTTWNVERVNAPDAWSDGTGSGVDLLIIDSGIDDNHSDLDVAVIQGCDETNGQVNGEDHGTLVAGVAAALNNTGDVIGGSYSVDLWSSKDGDATPSSDYTACGVEFGRTNDVDVINISTGYASSPTALFDQVAAAWDEGIVIVSAVGNDTSSVRYPAAYGDVIGVTATNTSDVRPVWANYGTGVELSAPGTSIRTTDLGGGTDIVAGTSFSSSIVAAAAAVTQGGPSELVKLVHSPGLAGQRRVSWFSHVLRVWHAGHRCCRGLLAHGLADRGHHRTNGDQAGRNVYLVRKHQWNVSVHVLVVQQWRFRRNGKRFELHDYQRRRQPNGPLYDPASSGGRRWRDRLTPNYRI